MKRSLDLYDWVIRNPYTLKFWCRVDRYQTKWVDNYNDATKGSKLFCIMEADGSGLDDYELINHYGTDQRDSVRVDKRTLPVTT